MHERHVLVLELLHVAHDLGLRVVGVERRVGEERRLSLEPGTLDGAGLDVGGLCNLRADGVLTWRRRNLAQHFAVLQQFHLPTTYDVQGVHKDSFRFPF